MAASMRILQTEMQALGRRLQGTVADLQRGNDQRFNQQGGDIDDLRRRVVLLEQGHREQVAVTGQLGDRLALDERAAARPGLLGDVDEWDRQPRLDVITVGARTPVPRDAVLDLLRELAARVSIPAEQLHVINGDVVDREFTVELRDETVAVGTRARRAAKILGTLRKPNGAPWERTAVQFDGEEVQVFLSRDQNKKQKVTRWCLKQLRDVLKEQPGMEAKKIFMDPVAGVLSSDWKQIAKVNADIEGEHGLQWGQAALDHFRLDRAVVDPLCVSAIRRQEVPTVWV